MKIRYAGARGDLRANLGVWATVAVIAGGCGPAQVPGKGQDQRPHAGNRF